MAFFGEVAGSWTTTLSFARSFCLFLFWRNLARSRFICSRKLSRSFLHFSSPFGTDRDFVTVLSPGLRGDIPPAEVLRFLPPDPLFFTRSPALFLDCLKRLSGELSGDGTTGLAFGISFSLSVFEVVLLAQSPIFDTTHPKKVLHTNEPKRVRQQADGRLFGQSKRSCRKKRVPRNYLARVHTSPKSATYTATRR